MYYKKLSNGKVKFFDTYKALNGKRRQVTITLETASAQSQRKAKNLIAQKIEKILKAEREADDNLHNATVIQVFEMYWNTRKREISDSDAFREKINLILFYMILNLVIKKSNQFPVSNFKNLLTFLISQILDKNSKDV